MLLRRNVSTVWRRYFIYLPFTMIPWYGGYIKQVTILPVPWHLDSLAVSRFGVGKTPCTLSCVYNPGGTMISSDLAKLMNDTIWSLQWRHNERHGVSNHRHIACFFHLLFKQPLKKTSKLRVIGLCEGNPAVTSNAKNVSICWHYHVNYCHTKSLLPDFEKYVFSSMASGILPGLLYGVRISLINDGSPSFYLANCRQS